MQLVKSKDGPLEVAIRSRLHRRGFRFRKHVKTLPGRPDVVFPTERIAVFIDGDFWHGYGFESWSHTLKGYWLDKIKGNIVRDQKNFSMLHDMGWTVIRIWQHEIKADVEGCVDRVERAVREARRHKPSQLPTLNP